jgi:DNA modification methylase
VRLGDARKLSHVAAASVDLVITSPPYLGTYDYAAHHARRFGWAGLDPRPLEQGEIGARRRATPEQWTRDVAAYVFEIARVLRPDGWAYLLVGDSAIGDRAIAGDEELRRAAHAARLSVVATASQARPDVYAPARGQLEGGRREHLVAIRRR